MLGIDENFPIVSNIISEKYIKIGYFQKLMLKLENYAEFRSYLGIDDLLK